MSFLRDPAISATTNSPAPVVETMPPQPEKPYEFIAPAPRTPTKIRKRRALEMAGIDPDLACDEEMPPSQSATKLARLFKEAAASRFRHQPISAEDVARVQKALGK